MSNVRRSAVALALVVGTLGSLGVALVATETPSVAQPACTDNWVGPTSGVQSWDSSGNWSAGAPNSSSVACIDEAGTYTVVYDGSNGPGAVEVGGAGTGAQTLEIDAVNIATTQPNEVESGGVLDLAPTSSGNAEISGSSLTVDSGGTLTSSGSADEADVESTLDNLGAVTLGATNNHIGVDTTNQGTFTVSSGASLTSSGSDFTDASGSLDVFGSFTAENTFTQSGATETGNPADIDATLIDSAGTGAFTAGGGGAIEGTIPVGQTVTVAGSNEVVGTSSTGLIDDGSLVLASTSGSYAAVSAGATSPGLTVAAGGTLTSTGTANNVQLDTPLVNQGTVTLGATANTGGSGPLTNEGTFNVLSGSSFSFVGANFTDASGSLNVGGSFTADNTFIQSGTTETGNPANIDGTLIDSAGTGSFTTGGATIEGTIPAGQTVTDVAANDPIGTSSAGVTVEGTLVCETTSNPNDYCGFSSGYNAENEPDPGLTVASGGALETTGPGSAPLQNVQMTVDIQIEPGGTMTVANPDTLYEGGGFAISNAGTLQVTGTGALTVGGSSTLASTGTIGVTVGSNLSSSLGVIVDRSYAPSIGGGTLAVTTVGSPSAADVIEDSSNGIDGSFASLSFGPDAYTVGYTGTAVELTPASPFAVSATSFTPADHVATGAVQVATITDATDGTGTYSATVDYGDGSGPEAATVSVTGDSGVVTGPSHTYTSLGAFLVTVTVANTDGTTIPVTEDVTVTGGPGGSVVVNKLTNLVGNKSIEVSGSGWKVNGDASVTIHECASTYYSPSSCDTTNQASASVDTNPASKVGDVPKTGFMVATGIIDADGDTCGLTGSPACYIVMVGSTGDETAGTALGFTAPSITVKQTSDVLGNHVDAIKAKGFPFGDTVVAEECDDSVVVPTSVATDCDAGTAISGTANAGGTVTFTAPGVALRVDGAYSDGASGACPTGGTCQIAVTDSDNPAIGLSLPVTFATPSVSLKKSTDVASGYADKVTAEDFPVGDTVTARECDSSVDPANDLATACDPATAITGTVGTCQAI